MLEQLFKIFLLFINSVLSFLKILIRSKLILTYKKSEQVSCIILGNGPSINQTLLVSSEVISNYTLFCVNHFPNTPYFEQLQPSYFVLLAKEYFDDSVKEEYKTNATILFRNLVEKTTWELQVFVPYSVHHKKEKLNYLASNPLLQINYFNDTPVEGLKKVNHFFFARNWGMPRPHNVLIPSLMLAINIGFKEIFVVGADHSWLEELTVNENNEALLHQKHFYDEDSSKPEYMYRQGKRPRKLHEILEKFMLSFRAYFTIKDYSESKKVQIWNATPKSYIDAFERNSLPPKV